MFPHTVIREAGTEEEEEEVCLKEMEQRPEFICPNPKCKMVTCRKCHKSNHPRLKCPDDLEESEDALRRYVQKAMDEALIRKCPHCSRFLITFLFFFFFLFSFFVYLKKNFFFFFFFYYPKRQFRFKGARL
jgi:hypothetical protein